jgi:anti-sigma factor RsiW
LKHATSELSAYLDGALDPAARARVEAHLEACPGCRTERDRLRAALALLARVPAPPAPSPAFEQRFYARLATERAEARERRGLLDRATWRWLAPGLAGAAATAAVALYVGGRNRADEAFLADHLELFRDYDAVASMDAVSTPEDVEVVAHLDELGEEGGK